MKERGILFDAEMVRAYLAGRKSQTRRIILGVDWANSFVNFDNRPKALFTDRMLDNFTGSPNSHLFLVKCPYGIPGDSLWVRETWKCEELPNGLDGVRFKADDKFIEIENTISASDAWVESNRRDGKWRPSMFMPRWASRITLEILDVRVEQLQDITEADARAEGWDGRPCPEIHADDYDPKIAGSALEWYRNLWRRLNGKKAPWKSNPWVWVITFPPNKP